MIRIAAMTIIAVTMGASVVHSRTETAEFTGMLASIVGDDVEWQIGAQAMEGGRLVYRDVRGRRDGLSIELQTARRGLAPDAAWLYLTGVRVAAGGQRIVAIERLAVDVSQIAPWTGLNGNLSSLCHQTATGDVVVLANGLHRVSEEGKAGFRTLEATIQLTAGPSGDVPCRLSASLDFGSLEMWRPSERVDVGGGRITLDLQPGRHEAASLGFSATQLLVSRLDERSAARAPARSLAVGSFNGHLGVSQSWAVRLLGSLTGLDNDIGEHWERLDPVGDFHLEALNADLEPAHLVGEEYEQGYRTATGKKAVAASARAVGRFQGPDLRARVQVYLPGVMDITLLTTLLGALDDEPEVLEADLLYRDVGLGELLEALKIGSAAELLTGPLVGLLPKDGRWGGTSAGESLQAALKSADSWLDKARSQRMQASIRPARPMPLFSMILMIAEAPEAAARALGLLHGPHSS